MPSLKIRKEYELITLLKAIEITPLQIDWEEIARFQELSLKEGINHVGIPDLIIVQNARDYDCALYAIDGHFDLMSKVIDFKLYNSR